MSSGSSKASRNRSAAIERKDLERVAGADRTAATAPTTSAYLCQFDPGNPRHTAAYPDHPRTVAAREDLLLDVLRDGLFSHAPGPSHAEHLAAFDIEILRKG